MTLYAYVLPESHEPKLIAQLPIRHDADVTTNMTCSVRNDTLVLIETTYDSVRCVKITLCYVEIMLIYVQNGAESVRVSSATVSTDERDKH